MDLSVLQRRLLAVAVAAILAVALGTRVLGHDRASTA